MRWDNYNPCGPLVECVCRDAANNDRLRDLLTTLDGTVVARPETPAQVWNETLARVASLVEVAEAVRAYMDFPETPGDDGWTAYVRLRHALETLEGR